MGMIDRGKGQSAMEETQEQQEEEIKKLFLGIMEGYNDTLIPPLSYFSPDDIQTASISRKKRQRSSKASSVGTLGKRASKASKDRILRHQITHNLSLLRSMVPSLSNESKPSHEKIVGETVDFIKYLQGETQRLERLLEFKQNEQKPDLSKHTNQNSVKVSVSSGATFIAIQLPSRGGLVHDAMKVLAKHQAEVLEARTSVNEQRLLTLTATVRLASDGGSTIDKIRQELSTL